MEQQSHSPGLPGLIAAPFASIAQASRHKAPDAGVASSSSSVAASTASSSVEKPAHDVMAGAMARAASQGASHPLDTLKVRMQAGKVMHNLDTRLGGSSSGTANLTSSLQRGISEVASLYKGVLSAATGAGIIIGAYFAFYSTTKCFLKERTQWKEGQIAFVSGATAAVGSSVVKVPIAVCIRSVQAGVYPNVMQAARSITKAAGARGLFTGFLPTLLEDVPDMAVKFAVYETLRITHGSIAGGRQPTTAEDLVMGGSAGAAAAAATTPLDVVKTRMMCSASTRPTVLGAARSVLAEGEGFKAFFRGVGPRALSNGLNSAMFFCFFEAIRRVLVQKQQQKAAALVVEQQQLVQVTHTTEQQQPNWRQEPVVALSSVNSSNAAANGSKSQRTGTGSGWLACLSLAIPLNGQVQTSWA